MTNKDTLAAIAVEIETLSAELRKVSEYIDILGKPAADKAASINKALVAAKDRFATALADEQVEARNLRLSRFSDIRVEVKPNNSLIDMVFVIHYEQLTWDMSQRASVPKAHTCNGFSALPDDVWEYLLTVKPQAIPAAIMALAPGKPQEAFSLYMQGKARGYFRDAVAA